MIELRRNIRIWLQFRLDAIVINIDMDSLTNCSYFWMKYNLACNQMFAFFRMLFNIYTGRFDSHNNATGRSLLQGSSFRGHEDIAGNTSSHVRVE